MWGWIIEFLINSPTIIRILLHPVKKKMLSIIRERVSIDHEVKGYVESAYNPPPLLFRIDLNNKAPTKVQVQSYCIWVFYYGIPLAKINWCRHEKALEGKESPVPEVQDPLELGEGYLNLRLLPPYVLLIPSNGFFQLKGYISFSCSWGDFIKNFGVICRIHKEEWEKASDIVLERLSKLAKT